MRRILVVNGKGGCGKTTVATNLAAAYAQLGQSVVLIDHDPQASSTQWLQAREPTLPRIHLLEAFRRTAMYTTRAFQQRLPADATRIVIDTPAAVGESELDALLRNVGAVVVPVVPSPIDMRAASQFLSQLRQHRLFRARPVPIGIVANRVIHDSVAYAKLSRFLDALDVPTLATFADAAVYAQLAEDGAGLFDLPQEACFEAELEAWRGLLRWLDGFRYGVGDAATAVRRGPTSAPVHERIGRSVQLQ